MAGSVTGPTKRMLRFSFFDWLRRLPAANQIKSVHRLLQRYARAGDIAGGTTKPRLQSAGAFFCASERKRPQRWTGAVNTTRTATKQSSVKTRALVLGFAAA